MMHRRAFLLSATAATVAAAKGGGVWLTYDGGRLTAIESSPFSAWSNWTAGGEPTTLKLVRSAILASSPHNTQPWRFRINHSFVELYLDANRKVSGLDPYLREAHIGMGCALENLLLAAAADGYATQVTLSEGALDPPVPEPPLRLVARVDLAPGTLRSSELYKAIPNRHTNRSIFDPSRELPASFADELLSLCNVDKDARLFLFPDTAQRAALTRISVPANFELYSDPDVENGSEQWLRWRSEEVKKHKDGIGIDNLGLSPRIAAMARLSPTWLLKRAASPSHRSALYEKQMQSARLIGIIAVRDRLEVRSCLQAGRLWQRIHLFATARGVGVRPCNEAVEMIDHERIHGQTATRLAELSQVTQNSEFQPTFLFLMGYSTLPAHPSPRRPVEEVEVTA
jgi:nitroreductase